MRKCYWSKDSHGMKKWAMQMAKGEGDPELRGCSACLRNGKEGRVGGTSYMGRMTGEEARDFGC